MLHLLILVDCFLCNSYPCVLFESLSHVINQESHVYSWNLGKIYPIHVLKFWNLPRFTRFQNFKKVNSVNLSRISLLPVLIFKYGEMTYKTFSEENLFQAGQKARATVSIVKQLLSDTTQFWRDIVRYSVLIFRPGNVCCSPKAYLTVNSQASLNIFT